MIDTEYKNNSCTLGIQGDISQLTTHDSYTEHQQIKDGDLPN